MGAIGGIKLFPSTEPSLLCGSFGLPTRGNQQPAFNFQVISQKGGWSTENFKVRAFAFSNKERGDDVQRRQGQKRKILRSSP